MVSCPHSVTACTGVILAGGLNTRFSGMNKAFMRFGSHRVIDSIFDVFSSVFEEIILVTHQPEDYLEWNATLVTDVYPVRSSLTGIHAGLFYSRTPFAFVTACDMPFLKKKIVETVVSRIEPGVAVVIPETAGGLEPLCAAYSRDCLPLMARRIQAKKFQIKKIFQKLRVKKIPEAVLRQDDPELISFLNINTDQDYSKAKETLAQKHGLLSSVP
ncbi:MAG: molybdenum cofactor guanylyltransferase [Desulfobacterales bacterium CG23_combo_of_CG06-09_8_20_14_all_51_8]|nr:MAG: molybdenum cofactor guanylyltransferase [Desulfobacterales bacterium CG23_combo_of_CG06-09_8_20_14_all_51_8]